MKLVQRQFLKGIREFEIIDDMVCVRIKSWFKEEKLTVGLSTLNPEPVTNGSELEFFSRYQAQPVISLILNKPTTESFNTFVEGLQQNIRGEGGTFDMTRSATSTTLQPEAPGWNVYDEPPEFNESEKIQATTPVPTIYADRLEQDIVMLKTYLEEDDIRPFIDSLEALKEAPHNNTAFQDMMDAYHDLGVYQGAVLTYAPYLKILLSQSLRL